MHIYLLSIFDYFGNLVAEAWGALQRIYEVQV